jgi:hypothetical protein
MSQLSPLSPRNFENKNVLQASLYPVSLPTASALQRRPAD